MPTYTCPMHSEVRQDGPGRCPKCKMALVAEGQRFAVLRHLASNPLHLAVMVVIMIVLVAAAMMIMRPAA